MSDARHGFGDGDRPTFLCTHVAVDGLPVLYVSHDGDGDWQFLCGGDHGEDEEPVVWRLADAVALDPALAELAELGCNHTAERVAPGQPWRIVDENEETIRAHVRDHGWHITAIAADDHGPSQVFSIGMETTLGHPEIIMFGLEPEVMVGVVNQIGRRLQVGETLAPGQPIAGLLDGVTCVLAPVDPRHYRDHLGYAIWFHGGSDFRVLQCFWPSEAGQMPWDDDAPADLVARQPDLRAAGA